MTDLAPIAVVVPSLHPDPARLFPLLAGAREAGFQRLVVIDDGSGPGYAHVFREAAQRFGAAVLTHTANHGKGRALKTGFEYCGTLEGVEGVVTADADGQHSPVDLARVALRVMELLALGREGAVFGVRAFDEDHVPMKSRHGNTLTSAVIKALFGHWISDTQTGLRGFPLNLALKCSDPDPRVAAA